MLDISKSICLVIHDTRWMVSERVSKARVKVSKVSVQVSADSAPQVRELLNRSMPL
jgi:hypothetical protein